MLYKVRFSVLLVLWRRLLVASWLYLWLLPLQSSMGYLVAFFCSLRSADSPRLTLQTSARRT